MLTSAYGVMHFFVDFVCAWAMFGAFLSGEGAYLNILIYNFCAFAMQMPLGTLQDVAAAKCPEKFKKWLPLIWTGSGAGLTVIGAATNPVLLGLGNALFHVGGGIDVMRSDFAASRGGRDLGVFVAPGAVGLYFGTRLGKAGGGCWPLILSSAVLAAGMYILIRRKTGEQPAAGNDTQVHKKGNLPVVLLCCTAVVILRSWIGFETNFGWKSGEVLGMLAVLAVASGKALGGFLAARFGHGKTVTATLLLAAVCFLFGERPVAGLAALLLFNMSMPVTLYLLAGKMPQLMGFSFGLLTFGLFLGFLPVYAGADPAVSAQLIGSVGSAVSALVMLPAWKAVAHDSIFA